MSTRLLTACGTAGAILFVAIFAVNGLVHKDYSPVRDTVSELAIGPGGWIQIVNFICTGSLMIAFAVGLRRALDASMRLADVGGERRRAGWAPRLVALYGAFLIVSGVFITDPVPSSAVTTHGTVHLLASLVVFGSLTAACFVLSRRFRERGWRIYSRVTGVAVPVFFIAVGTGPPSTVGLLQRVAIVAGWSWIAAVSVRLTRSARPAAVFGRPPVPEPERRGDLAGLDLG